MLALENFGHQHILAVFSELIIEMEGPQPAENPRKVCSAALKADHSVRLHAVKYLYMGL